MRLKLLTKEERKANEQFDKLIARLHSKTEAERLAAVAELREQWPDGMQRLLSGYQFTMGFWKKRWRLGVYSTLWFLTATILLGYFASKGYPQAFAILQIFMWPLVIIILFNFNGSKLRNDNVRHMLIFEDVKIVGPLIDALDFRDESTQQEARQALIKLLPRLQASDAHLLNREQRERLRKILFTDYRHLALSVLKAYEHIGDGAELQAVERLLQNAIWDAEVRDAALNCLPFLQWRAQQMQSSQTLLRAVERATTPDILLRPATHAPTEDEAQLLRMSGK